MENLDMALTSTLAGNVMDALGDHFCMSVPCPEAVGRVAVELSRALVYELD